MRVGLYLILGLAAVLEWCALVFVWPTPSDGVASAKGQVVMNQGVSATQQVRSETTEFAGTVHSDIWSSAKAAGLGPREQTQLAEIFAWQLDLNRDLQPGDRWRLTLDEHAPGAKQPRAIVAAEVEQGGQVFQAVRFANGKSTRYFAADGSSLERQFLHSPLYRTHVTSAFARHRFHPILKVRLPHLGVDYGAPQGTPVMAAGAGIVMAVGFQGGAGKSVVLSHGHRYQTRYKHLSRFARPLKVGQRVKMGEIIAYVGATGLATGPHLHYEFYDGPRVINPQAVDFPATQAVAADELPVFQKIVAKVQSRLPPWTPRAEVAAK